VCLTGNLEPTRGPFQISSNGTESFMARPLAIVLAAGKGKRMDADRPKVLCEALGRPLIDYVLDALEGAGLERTVVVVGYQAQRVRDVLANRKNVEFVEQTEQRGTGHAVSQCRGQLAGHDGAVLVVAGDSPLLQSSSIRALLDEFQRDRPAGLLGTLHKDNPAGLGRIVRDPGDGRFLGIVEEKDATAEQRRITEVNMSTYVFDCQQLLWALDRVRNDNVQGEYYLTDCPGILQAHGREVRASAVLKPCEAFSVNTVEELQLVEAELRRLGH
jgi:bifunctional UDP-N-acetylglucosamine pyrophosphorylase/glucosamine-1-phosphate N-acetyltransferase/UDP-N-acetylglucosamine pyrophosphorylase